jgi:hypothetical protein
MQKVEIGRLKKKNKSLTEKKQFLETPSGVDETAGAGIKSMFNKRAAHAGCSVC